jgi:1-acyl-sn-glycerol-3-phosphate acyltransferase
LALKLFALLGLIWILFFKQKGWTVVGQYPHALNKMVIVVGPHTSSADFWLGLGIRSYVGMKGVRYLGKKELFRPPFGFIFRWLGGTPVDRHSNNNLVDQVVEKFEQHRHFVIAMSPEGTRQKVDRIRTGFYHIAKKAGVPILMVAFDFGNKQVVFADPFLPTQNEAADFKTILDFFGPVQGKVPALGMGHLL